MAGSAAANDVLAGGGTNNGLLYIGANGLATTTAAGSTGNFTCLDDGEASAALRAVDGRTRFISMLGYSLIYSNLDRALNPSQGLYAELRQDFAGVGGNARFIRTTGEARYYHDLSNEWIGMLRVQAGNITGWGATKTDGGKA